MNCLVVYGSHPALARAELVSVSGRRGWGLKFVESWGRVDLVSVDRLPQADLSLLGGTYKVGEYLGEGKEQDLAERLALILCRLGKEKLDFGVSFFSPFRLKQSDVSAILRRVKKILRAQGIKASYVLSRDGDFEISSVVVKKRNLREMIVVGREEKTVVLGATTWVQDFTDWNKRDYGRPKVAAKLGMLPPKVARMMVNVGLSASGQRRELVVLDPFCGVGTIAAEALILGCRVIASDIAGDQVERTRENLLWLKQNYEIAFLPKLLVADGRKISLAVLPKSVDAIVTEPYLGVNSTSSGFNQGIRSELLDLYLDCLGDWKKVLAAEGKVVIALPSFVISRGREDATVVESVIDKAGQMGYSFSSRPLPYFRPQARVRRNICIFRLD